jgi:hypothetical protein
MRRWEGLENELLKSRRDTKGARDALRTGARVFREVAGPSESVERTPPTASASSQEADRLRKQWKIHLPPCKGRD